MFSDNLHWNLSGQLWSLKTKYYNEHTNMHHTSNNVLSVLKPAFFENTIQNILNSALQLGYKNILSLRMQWPMLNCILIFKPTEPSIVLKTKKIQTCVCWTPVLCKMFFHNRRIVQSLCGAYHEALTPTSI